MNPTTLREVSNLSGSIGDVKQRLAQRIGSSWDSYRLAPTTHMPRSSLYDLCPGTKERSKEMLVSPRADRCHANDPVFCNSIVKDITTMYMEWEKQTEGKGSNGQIVASPRYLMYQPEINEKMRMILVDWLVDVHLKFKLHAETMYLAVNILDRYLSTVNTKQPAGTYVARSQLQLVGITAILLAAKYEEIWPPVVKECVHISANTYTREEVLKMERSICSALSFRLTVPTPFPHLVRLLNVMEGLDHSGSLGEGYDVYLTRLRHTAFFFMEHGMLDYKCLQFTSSQHANASLFLALLTLRIKQKGGTCSFEGETIWTRHLQHYSKTKVCDFKACAEAILEFVNYVPTTKYQAVRRKYSSAKYGEVTKLIMPNEVPDH
ncbi:CYC2-like cyclin [Trypanosoma rangeli SC58]|uniref:CYC2-like cyclin n=1 Tax=Trypanosoma rangeli SC58 TaxID=429131 RepID=A0A061J1Y2_TRYRA|nr:CYC2-like cyclin [Trypanosoma rangeli SC58]